MPRFNCFRFDPFLGFLPQETCVVETLGAWVRWVLDRQTDRQLLVPFIWGEILLVSPSSIVSLVAAPLGMHGGNSLAAPLLKGT